MVQVRAPTLKLPTCVTVKAGSSSHGATPQIERFRDFGPPITAVRRSPLGVGVYERVNPVPLSLIKQFRELGSPITVVRRGTGPAIGIEAVTEESQVGGVERQVPWLDDDDQDGMRAISPERYTHPVVCDGGKMCEAARAAHTHLANVVRFN